MGSQLLILTEDACIPFVIYGIIGFLAGSKGVGIFVGNDRKGLGAILEMLVFDDTGVGHGALTVVYHGIALEVIGIVQPLVFKTLAAILQVAAAIIEIFVDATGVEDASGQGLKLGTMLEEVDTRAHFHTFEQGFDKPVVSAYGDALIGVVEVIVVESKAQGNALDDESRQLGGGTMLPYWS